ncbi:hypothetical protein [Kribbella sp. NPDC051137]|uniref:hypothetical protein n=1 Tax=Kribbella sp. NPDC051137 TaxID=3155045 RepID=UPI00343A7881
MFTTGRAEDNVSRCQPATRAVRRDQPGFAAENQMETAAREGRILALAPARKIKDRVAFGNGVEIVASGPQTSG